MVVSGAPGTGKSPIARELGAALRLPVLSLDPIKEALADVLGLGDEDWSNRVGSAAYIASLASDVTPLRLGGPLVDVDTGRPGAAAAAVAAVRAALGR
jgi:predicted kinase